MSGSAMSSPAFLTPPLLAPWHDYARQTKPKAVNLVIRIVSVIWLLPVLT